MKDEGFQACAGSQSVQQAVLNVKRVPASAGPARLTVRSKAKGDGDIKQEERRPLPLLGRSPRCFRAAPLAACDALTHRRLGDAWMAVSR